MFLIPALGRQRQEDVCESSPSWSTEHAPGQLELQGETLPQNKQTNKQTNKQQNSIQGTGAEDLPTQQTGRTPWKLDKKFLLGLAT